MRITARQFAFGLFLVPGILLYSCGPKAEPTPAPTEAPVQPAGPPEGTLMSWVDGSTLVFYKGVWVYQSEVTNYQFSLCVESGICLLPYIDAPSPDLIDPQQANLPAQIIGPETQQEYCGWAGGRLPTEAEATAVAIAMETIDEYFVQVRGFSVEITNAEVAPIIPSFTDVDMGGLPSTEIMSGFRCVIDDPRPLVAACQTSAFYLNGRPFGIDHRVEQAGTFCQNGQSFVTLDINLPEGESLQSVNGDCEVVGDNRVLCSGQPGSSGEGAALIQWSGLPAVQDNSAPAAGQMQCLPGYEVNEDLPTQCDFNRLLPAVQDDSGPAVSSESQFAGQVSLVVYQPNPMQSANQQQTCPAPLTFSERLGQCVFAIPVEDLAGAGRNKDGLPVWNPLTGYPPPNADGTCPEGSSLLNGLYCIPNEPAPGEEDCLFFRYSSGYGSNYLLTNGNNCGSPPVWNPVTGYPPANADGTCPDGTTLLYGHCIPAEPPPSEEEGGPLEDVELRLPSWNPFAGYPPASADGTCPEGSTNFYGYCIPDEPASSEDEDDTGWGFGWNPITGYPPRNADGTCPEGTSLFLDLYCLPNGAARNEEPSFSISWDPLGGFPLPDGYGGCPEGSALISGHCVPSEPPLSGYVDLNGSGFWNPLAGYPSPGEDGICPPGSTLFNVHCLPSEPTPSEDPRCMPGYWFSETLGVCLPDVTLGCPVGTYYDKDEGMCIASGESISLTLPGFHFDEASQCSLTDLPSRRYPGCPAGQAFDPTTGLCDFENTWIEGGKRLYAVEFSFSASSCNTKDSGDGACPKGQTLTCPDKNKPENCSCQ